MSLKWRLLAFLTQSSISYVHCILLTLCQLKTRSRSRCCSSRPRAGQRQCPISWEPLKVNVWGGWSSASQRLKMPTSAWLEAVNECENPAEVLAHDSDRGRDDHPPTADRWIYPVCSFIPAYHYCPAGVVDADRQRR